MGYFEINLFYKIRSQLGNKVALYFWDMYKRYLDDGMMFWDTRLGDFMDVFNIMNSLCPTINFTMERSFSKLTYLDLVIYKSDTGIKTSVYNKDTDSGNYLPWTSSHPRHVKSNIPFNLARRIRTLTDDDTRAQASMLDLSAKLKKGGYPPGLVGSAVSNVMKL